MNEQAGAGPANGRTFLALAAENWPYLTMLALAMIGVALSSVSPGRMIVYWESLAPIFGVLCFFARGAEGFGDEPLRAVREVGLHWIGVLATMRLLMLPELSQMLNADALGLMLLAVLALGTFLAGNHLGSWKIAVTGVLLAVAVPGIAWVERAVLLLALVGAVALAAAFFSRRSR